MPTISAAAKQCRVAHSFTGVVHVCTAGRPAEASTPMLVARDVSTQHQLQALVREAERFEGRFGANTLDDDDDA